MKLILSFFCIILTFVFSKEKFNQKSKKYCFSETVSSYMNKLRSNIYLDSRKLNNYRMLELKPLYDYTILIFKIKQKYLKNNKNIIEEINLILKITNEYQNEKLKEISERFLEKFKNYSLNQNDFIEMMNFLKRFFLDVNVTQSEYRLISNLLTYEFQFIHLGSIGSPEETCLSSDFEYIISLNKYKCIEEDKIGGNVNSSEGFHYIDIKDSSKDLTNINNLDNIFYSNEFVIHTNSFDDSNFINAQISNNISDPVIISEPVSLGEHISDYFRKNNLNQSKNKFAKRILQRNKSDNDQKIICAKVLYNLREFIIDDSRFKFNMNEILNTKETTSFYLIIDSSMQIFETSSEVYVFSDSSRKIFYKIKKEENEGNFKVFHIFNISDQEIKFELNSFCSQNIHFFFNFKLIDDQIKLTISTRFTNDISRVIKQTLSVKLEENFYMKNQKSEEILIFNKKIIKVINTFKNFNFSLLEEITLIYKIDHILEFSKKKKYQNIMINNILSNEFLNNNNVLYDYDSDIFDIGRNFIKINPEEIYKIKSSYLNFEDCVCPIEKCLICSQDKKECLKCQDNSIFFKDSCINGCPLGTYLDKNKGICLDCPINCSECEKEKCKKCENPYKLNSEKICVIVEFQEKITKCDDDKNCKVCDLETADKCYLCKNEKVLYENKCVDNCPDGFYKNEKDNTCKECIANCSLCSYKGICDKCNDGFLNLRNIFCIKCSDLGYSLSEDGKNCIKCNLKNCNNCDKNDPNICSICKENYFLNEDGMCGIDCPDGYFKNRIDGNYICSKCSTGCIKCGSNTNCLECDESLFNLDNGLCKRKINNVQLCSKCKDESCLECPDHEGIKCKKCIPGKHILNGKCIKSCPKGFYSNNGICLKCPENCYECKLNIDTNKPICMICEDGFKLENNSCKSPCGEGRFENKVKEYCQKCNDESCVHCENANMCKKCSRDRFLFVDEETNVCLDYCPTGYFSNQLTNNCQKCQENCKICIDEEICEKCNIGFYLFDKKCLTKCPDGHGNVDGICKKCSDDDCLLCSENDLKKCIECKKGKFFYRDRCIDDEECFSNNRYADIIEKRCKNCDVKCKKCKDKNTCLECFPEYELDKKTMKCINRCPDNKVIDLESKNCICCKDPLCKNCLNNGERCVACEKGSNLLDTACYKFCPMTYFKDAFYNKCRKCSKGCEKCSNKQNCEKCLSGFYLTDDGNCSKKCPGHFFSDISSRRCIECDKSCSICLDKNNKNCAYCSFGYFKFNKKCLKAKNCPKGTFPNFDLRECTLCQISNCIDCTNNKICNVCKENFEISKDSSLCIPNKKMITFIERPEMYSKYIILKNQTSQNMTFTDDFRISCKSNKSITFSFWSRIITDNLKSMTLFEITNPFYDYYFSSNRTVKFNPEKFNNPGFFFNLKLILKKQIIKEDSDKLNIPIYKCISELMFVKADLTVREVKLERESCSFLLLKEWTLFTISINLINFQKGDFKFLIFDKTLDFQFPYSMNILENFYYDQELLIISPNSFISIGKDYNYNPIFEMSLVKFSESIYEHKELIDILKTKPSSCDINCSKCDFEKCLLCKDNKSYEDGYCKPTYISIEQGLKQLYEPIKIYLRDINTDILYNYLSSDRYTFLTFFNIKSSNSILKLQELLIFQTFYYNNVSLFEIYLLNGGKLKIIFNGKNELICNIIIQLGSWYGINISIEKNSLFVKIINDENEILFRDEKLVDGYNLRLTNDAEIYIYGGISKNNLYDSNADIVIYDTRLYLNNVFKDIPLFQCEKNCAKCDRKRKCVVCAAGFVLSQGHKGKCIIEESFNPIRTIKRKSYYDFDGNFLFIPKESEIPSITGSFWMKKNLDSKPGSNSTLINFVDLKNDYVYTIFKQRVSNDGHTHYVIDLRNMTDKNISKSIIYDYRNRNMSDIENNYKYERKMKKKFIKYQYNRNKNNPKLQEKSIKKYLEYSVKYPNNTFNYFHFAINIHNKQEVNQTVLTFSLRDSFANIKFDTKFTVNVPILSDFDIYIGDNEHSNINMVFGPIRFFKGNLIQNEEKINNLMGKTYPKECDPGCKDCDYNTGACLICGIDKLNSRDCNTFFYGFTKSMYIPSTNGNFNEKNEIIQINRRYVQKDQDFSTSLSEVFDIDINSKTYSVIGWFYILDFPYQGKESIVYRLSNCDYGRFVNESKSDYKYDSGLNLITLKIINNEKTENKPRFYFLISGADKDKEILIDLIPEKNKWLLVYAGINSDGLYFEYGMDYNKNISPLKLNKFNLTDTPAPVQEITTLKMFGIDSVTNNNLQFLRAVAFHTYIISNTKDVITTIKDYQRKVDPLELNAFKPCEEMCETCILDSCIKCKRNFQLVNEHCIRDMNQLPHKLYINQDNHFDFEKERKSIVIDRHLVNDGYFSVEFFIRRNYHHHSILNNLGDEENDHKKNESNRNILTIGNFEVLLLNDNDGSKLKFLIKDLRDEYYNKNSTNELTMYTSNDVNDFEWHHMELYFNRTNIQVQVFDVDKTNEKKINLIMEHKNLIDFNFKNIFVNTLKSEVSIFGLTLYKTKYILGKSEIPIPRLDCPIDCTFCDVYPDNICLKCNYGVQCTLNNSRNQLCKFRFINLPSFFLTSKKNYNYNVDSVEEKSNRKISRENFYLNPDSPINEDENISKNIVKLSYYYENKRKIVRFRSFTLKFTVSIDLTYKYDSIVKILNYRRDSKNNNDNDYEFLNLSFDSIEKVFKFSFSSKYIIRTSMNSTYNKNIKSYGMKNNLNQNHYIAITYNEQQKLFNLVILNSKENYILDNISSMGNVDYLGRYSEIIFGDKFEKVNDGEEYDDDPQLKIFDVKFMHENALNTNEIIKMLQKDFENNYMHGCKSIDLRTNSCKKCDENLEVIDGVCHYKNLKHIEIKYPLDSINNYDYIPKSIYLNYNNTEKVKSLTIQFSYLELESDSVLSGILKFSKFKVDESGNLTSFRNILSLFEKDDSFIFVFKPFSDLDDFYYFFIDNLYNINESYAWLYFTININFNIKIITVIVYNYKSLETKTFRFDYLKEYEEKEKNNKKNFHVLELDPNEKLGFDFDFEETKLNISSDSHNIIYEENANGSVRYRLSTLVFFVDRELNDKQIEKIIPLRPAMCICSCKCINNICPISCKFDKRWIVFKYENFHKSDNLFERFFEIIDKHSVSNKKYNIQIVRNQTNIPSLYLHNYFKRVSISFRVNFDKFIKLINEYFTRVLEINYVKEFLEKYFAYKDYIEEVEKCKENGIINFQKNTKIDVLFQIIEKAFTIQSFRDKVTEILRNKKNFTENKIDESNFRYLFILSDSLSALDLRKKETITNDIITDSIFSLKSRRDKFTVYIGGNKQTYNVYKKDLDIDSDNFFNRKSINNLAKIKNVFFYLNIDMENNMVKIIIFINDMRKDFEFKFSHKTDYLGYFSSLYVNPGIDDLYINVGEVSIAQHLRKIKKLMNETSIKENEKFCDDKNCDRCFIGNKKYLRRCLDCSKKSNSVMYNNYCRNSSYIPINNRKFPKRRNNNESTKNSNISSEKKDKKPTFKSRKFIFNEK